MIFTRELINKNILYHQFSKRHQHFEVNTFDDLSKLIDGYKNLLLFNGCKVGQTVLLSLEEHFNTLAAFIASSELGLSIVIPTSTADNRVKQLLPINYFLTHARLSKTELKPSESKATYFSNVSDKVIDKLPFDFTPNNTVYANADSIHHVCTSSGTTGTPKRIEHTHEFVISLAKRNASYMGKNITVSKTFNHGSSLVTYYVPALISNTTEGIYFYKFSNDKSNNVTSKFDSIQFTYPDLLEEFVATKGKNPNLTAYVLSAIRPEWMDYVSNGVFKDIVSFYGTSETSGPILIQSVKDSKFAQDRFISIDDYYPINIEGGTLETIIPTYNRPNNTQDLFEYHPDGGYKFLGRKDLVRINDIIIPTKKYDSKLKEYFSNFTLTYDTLQNKIYLSIWDGDENIAAIEECSNFMKENSEGRHYITKYDYLTYQDFVTGIKLDQELLREYYRNK